MHSFWMLFVFETIQTTDIFVYKQRRFNTSQLQMQRSGTLFACDFLELGQRVLSSTHFKCFERSQHFYFINHWLFRSCNQTRSKSLCNRFVRNRQATKKNLFFFFFRDQNVVESESGFTLTPTKQIVTMKRNALKCIRCSATSDHITSHCRKFN